MRAGVFAAMAGVLGCTAYEARPIDWAAEASRPATNRVEIASADHAAQLLRIIMVLGNVFGYTVKDASPGKHAEHGNQLAEICRQPKPRRTK